jgi:hypothetical protein
MSIDETAAKLEKYRKRVKKGKTKDIKPKHVRKIRTKLEHRREHIDEQIADKPSKKEYDRLIEKRGVVNRLIERADWLHDQL